MHVFCGSLIAFLSLAVVSSFENIFSGWEVKLFLVERMIYVWDKKCLVILVFKSWVIGKKKLHNDQEASKIGIVKQ